MYSCNLVSEGPLESPKTLSDVLKDIQQFGEPSQRLSTPAFNFSVHHPAPNPKFKVTVENEKRYLKEVDHYYKKVLGEYSVLNPQYARVTLVI